MAQNKVKIELDVNGQKKVIDSLEEAKKLVDDLSGDDVDIRLEIDGKEAANNLGDVKDQLNSLQDAGKKAPNIFNKISKGWKSLNGVLKASIIGFIASAVIELVQNNRALEPVINAISDAFGVLSQALNPVLKALTSVLVPVIKALMPLLKIITVPLQLFAEGLTFLFEGVQKLKQPFNDFIDSLGPAGKFIEGLINPIGALSGALSSVFGDSSQKEVEEFNKKQRELETQVAKNEAAAEKFRGEREKLLAIAESEGVAEEDRLELFQKAAAIGRKESAQRIEAAQRKVDLIREDIRLNGESQDVLQKLAEAEQELSTQKADAVVKEEESQARLLDNAKDISESENLTFQEKKKQIAASFEQIKIQKEQNIEAIQRKLTEIDITEELIRQNTEGKQQSFFLNEVKKVRQDTKEELKAANLELESLNKKEKKLLDTSLETNTAIATRNKLRELGNSAELIEAELELAQARATSSQEQLANLEEFENKRLDLIENRFQQEVINAEGNADLISAAEARKQTEILNLERETVGKRKELLDELSGNIQETDRLSISFEPDIKGFTPNSVDFIQEQSKQIGQESAKKFGEGFSEFLEDEENNQKITTSLQIISQSFDQINGLAQQLFQNRIDSLQQGLESVNEQLNAQSQRVSEAAERAKNATGEQKKAAIAALRAEERQNAKLTKQKLAAEEKIAEQKRKQAVADKANAITQAVIQTALGVVGAFAPPEGGPIRGGVLAAIIGALGAVQIATIAAQPIPQFAEGGFTGQGGKFDPAGIVHKGEYVVPKKMVESPKFSGTIRKLENARLRGYAEGGRVSEVENLSNRLQKTEVVVDVREVIDQSERVKNVRSRASL